MTKKKKWLIIAGGLIFLIFLAILLYNTEFVQSHLGGRVEEWKANIFYFFNPPEEITFNPNSGETFDEQVAAMVQETMDAFATSQMQTSEAIQALTPTATITPTMDQAVTVAPTITPIPTQTSQPIPPEVRLEGMTYFNQHGVWNYCAPANLAMAMSFWGWQGTREDPGAYLRGGIEREDDKNVMPYEMVNYIVDETNLYVVSRVGGDLQILKELLAGGYPVVVEKDFVLDGVGWMGHFLTLFGYDEASQQFYVNDSYQGQNLRISYSELEQSWQSFNYLFMVVYPPDHNEEIYRILGNYGDPNWAYQKALEIANEEKDSTTGIHQFFAWANLGSSYNSLNQYEQAAIAFDTSFAIYNNLPEADRPWRMNWYQTGPYRAYYFTGRYQDVIDLADTILDAMRDPILEESYYWRSLAKEALGDVQGALNDLSTSVSLNPNFTAGWTELTRIQGGQ